ncbi:MAG TPA: formimidoylglutamase [Flavobacteriaceae bacterium]|nr:formimidoylglutamase [Flavobacteriaceae bacterium]
MYLDFLNPVDQEVLSGLKTLHPSCLGKKIAIHSASDFPDLEGVKVALLGIRENRREQLRLRDTFDFNSIRASFYELFPGHWDLKIADLGDIYPGETVEDTEYALHEIVKNLLERKVIPLILGGSQDLTYAQYRAYDFFKSMINVVNIDARFDIGNIGSAIQDNSYIGKMIVSEPYNLFNYVNLGYQSYLNPPEEIELIDKLFFEAYRLGNLSENITLAEPMLRDADLVSLDISSVSSTVSKGIKDQPNGFGGREICALSRYAGISERVSSFGLFNLQNLDPAFSSSLLPAEIIWYFIEGLNYRKKEENISTSKNFLKYSVPLDNEVLTFYKSILSERWWIKIPTRVNNKLKKPTFLPCSQEDYLIACNQQIPDRWYKARRKNEI